MPEKSKTKSKRTKKTKETPSKDETEMKKIAEGFLKEVSGEVTESHEPGETEIEKNIRLSKERMVASSAGTPPPSPSPEQAAALPAKPKAKPKKPAVSAKLPKLPEFTKANDKAAQFVDSIIAQLKVQSLPGGFSSALRGAAAATVRSCDAPHPNSWSPDATEKFWKRYFELLVDQDRMFKVVRWRLANDRFCTGVAAFKAHVRFAAVTAMLELIE